MPKLVAPLLSGPLDVVGDVHGEFAALQALLERLGYRPDGVHPDGRRLVFVGDLVDRGPQSVSVLRFVAPLLEAGLAQCVMGNHELNLLLRDRKHGNDWFFGEPGARAREEFGACEWLQPGEQAWVDRVLQPLPIALERADLRVVHASWCQRSLGWCRVQDAAGGVEDTAGTYRVLARAVRERAEALGLVAAMEEEERALGPIPQDRSVVPPLYTAFAAYDAFEQMEHPLAVLCSSQEKVSQVPFWANGKWRMTDRVAWWRQYHDAVPVIFGHYWRWIDERARAEFSRGEPDLFIGDGVDPPLPTRGGPAWCADFSVGARYRQRRLRREAGEPEDGAPFAGRLAALRWPEREWVFDTPLSVPAMAAVQHKPG